MKHLSEPKEFRRRFRKRIFLAFLFGIMPICFAGAQNVITGTVTDEKQEPVIGASVIIKNTTRGTTTDVNGKYSISVGDQNAVLIFSLVGYTRQEHRVGSQTVINVRLAEDAELMDEVVVVGFQTQKKVNLTGAVTAISAEAFENRPVSNIGQALQGVVPNLNIAMSDGKPNTVPSFNIRGTTSIDYNETDKRWELQNGSPLILVDGVEMTAALVNQMNPNDVESMSVIKDASAAAIYGTKATFGVILITTKSGKFNQKGKVSYSYELSLDKPSALPDIMNAYEIQRFAIQNAQWTSATPVTVSDLDKRKLEGIEKFMQDPTNPENRYIMNGNSIVWTGNMNPYKLVVRDWTPTQKHNLSISGGSDKVAYFLSLGYHMEEGMYRIGQDAYDRYNMATRFNAKVTDRFNVETRINYNRNSYDEPYVPSYKGAIWSILKQDADKNINMPIKTLSTDPAPAGEQWTDNYLAWLDYGARTVTNRWTTVLAVSPEYIVIPNTLKFKADLSYTPQGRTLRRVNPSHYYVTYTWTPVSEQDEYKENRGQLEKDVTDNYQMNVYADFNKTFKKHTLSAIAGYNQEYVEYSWSALYLRKLFSPDILKPGATEDPTLNTMSTSAQRRTGRALFGRINYNFAGKYLFEVNGRYDGSSRFTPGGRFYFFPSFSAGWRISEEEFMDFASSWLSNLKIRFSYGKLGSQPDKYYPYQPVMDSGTANYWINGSWSNTVYPPNLMSPYLTWEKAATTNYGADIALFKSRLNASLDIYERKTTDILVEGGSAYPNLLGVAAPRENSGVLRTRGWELSLEWADRLSNGLRYNLGINVSDATTKVLNYPSNAIKTLGDYLFYDGMTVGEIWGYETGGILQAEDLVANGNQYIFYGPQHSSNLYPGDPWIRDLNGDGIISTGSNTADNPGDRRIIGNNTPRYKFGVTLGLNWKGFDLNVLLQGVAKRDVWIGSTSYWGGGTNNAGSKWMYERSWKPDQTDAKFPRYRSTAGGPATQTGWLVNGAYLRMKQAVIGYTLPASVTRKLSIEKLRFTVSGYNLFEVTEIPSILDPDQLSDAYPQKRTIAVGAQLTF